MIKVELNQVNVRNPENGWRQYYQDTWQELCDKTLAEIQIGRFKNAFQVARWIENSDYVEGENPFAEEGSRFPGGRPMMRDTSFRGAAYVMPHFSKPGIPELIANQISTYGPFDAVVEIGSGWGRNLFDIFYHSGCSGPYFGGEITSSGRKLGECLSSLAEGMKVSFHPYDHDMPDLSFIGKKDKVLVFSVHSIEQVHNIREDFFDLLCGFAAETVGIHIEPFGFQAEVLGKITELHKQAIIDRGWNVNFLDTLRGAEKRDLLNIECIATEIFCSADLGNPSSFAMWQAKRQN